MFQRVGAAAFNKNIDRTLELMSALDHPESAFKSIHIAGTNGKGTSAHMLASIMQESGYMCGLYTSPHLKSFTERIKVNGDEVEERYVVDFVNQNREVIDRIKPSFFEITVAMAFDYFRKKAVDIAVIEVGMGGRLDSTNVIHPEISLITHISWDHMQFLGNTLKEIAGEKAGIIKYQTPVVIGKRQPEVEGVFRKVADEKSAPIYFTDDWEVSTEQNGLDVNYKKAAKWRNMQPGLKGKYIAENLAGVLEVCQQLKYNFNLINDNTIEKGIERVILNTGIKGRWQQLQEHPSVICDTGHNPDGIRILMDQIHELTYDRLHIVLGTVKDKDLDDILILFPKTASYYFCQPSIPRALDANELYLKAKKFGLNGEVILDVNDALKRALSCAGRDDLIFIGGSTFVVAELEGL